ncbi:hypothetical protein POX_b02010 [Penicillium oxalicum]|uniref:hypothetical protein n=1 Tax=Penicillium oxalicum TaxID=69781 RepID=UPI0020B76F2C|nr:hypothetical protein POX_b02010 [Penicillium oxalicum]KAI2791981.1 hypothetical protein POX_b02010 [Penicillium oxalicum]
MSVIVFGPTGSVGSIVALTAHNHGSKVYLAMRNTHKPIPGLSPQDERNGTYERVQADLSDPDSVAAAIQSSGAKRAFIYLAHGSPDHMKTTLQALKAAGVEFIVFLSSYTVGMRGSGDGEKLQDIPSSEVIPYVHARVEMNLDEVFGSENYVALRPGGFATNMLFFKEGIAAGEVKMYKGKMTYDCIVPRDIGLVGGTILVQGPRNGQRKVYLYGPRVLSQIEGIEGIGKVIGKEIKIIGVGEEEGREMYVRNGIPKAVVDYLMRITNMEGVYVHERPDYDVGVENVRLYTGLPAMGFEEWVQENHHHFL